MNKIAFILLVMVVTYKYSSAQQSQGTLFGGMNYSSIRHSDMETSYLPGYFAGIEFTLKLDDNYYLKAQPQYTRVGTKFNSQHSSGKMKVNYFKLPVKIRQYIDLSGTRFFIEGGPYASLGGSGKIETKGDANSMYFRNIDFGLSAATGVDFESINICLGYDLGVYEIAEYSDYQVYNRNVFIMIGFKW